MQLRPNRAREGPLPRHRAFQTLDRRKMILGLHHAQITIPRDAETEARLFYCEVLGLEEIPKPEVLRGRGGFWIQLAGVQIHVGTEDGVDRRKTKAHLGFEVDDVDAMKTIILSRGLEVFEGDPLPGLVRFEMRDPFGNRLEFLERLAPKEEGKAER